MQSAMNQMSWSCIKMLKHLERIVCTSKDIPAYFHQYTSAFPRYLSSSAACHQKNRVAIIGSGPAGFYTAQQILKGKNEVNVDMYEKLPVPFGLVRFGVAPDHPEVKNVISTFTNTAQKDRLHFFGNVEVGKDVTLDELRKIYSAVVLCYGAAYDRTLGIPGEDLQNCLSARSFVGWYNGLPEDKELQVNLDCESAVILGHGNVALDAARMLLTPVDILAKTDITEHALDTLRKSKIKRVHVVGRRGPLQVAFTIKELREMIRLPETRTVINSNDVNGLDEIIKDLKRPRKRLTELLHKAGAMPSVEETGRWEKADREWRLVFQRTPLRIKGSEDGKVTGVEFAVNELKGDSLEDQKAVMTDVKEAIDCGLVLRSIGYKSSPINDSVPFNHDKGTISNQYSRVDGQKGLYCAGWVGSGPVGVILTTMTDGFDTGKVVLSDLDSGNLPDTNEAQRDALMERISSKAVSFEEWEKIDRAEMKNGEKIGKPREKFVDVPRMLGVAKSL